MPDSAKFRCCLVIPCFNEQFRLNVPEFVNFGQHIQFVFVDDGSTDQTYAIIKKLQGECPGSMVLKMDRNRGKGHAIRQAMLGLAKSVNNRYWIGYWDADLATPLAEVFEMIKTGEKTNADAVIAIRQEGNKRLIKRTSLRKSLNRGFSKFLNSQLGLSYIDTQCGAKIFRGEILLQAFNDPFLSKWLFDIEVLLRLKTRHVDQYPLKQWIAQSNSKIGFLKLVKSVPYDLIRILATYK